MYYQTRGLSSSRGRKRGDGESERRGEWERGRWMASFSRNAEGVRVAARLENRRGTGKG